MVEELGLESGLAATIARWRRDVARVMRGKDDRLLVIVGPCSVHDPAAAHQARRAAAARVPTPSQRALRRHTASLCLVE